MPPGEHPQIAGMDGSGRWPLMAVRWGSCRALRLLHIVLRRTSNLRVDAWGVVVALVNVGVL